MKQTATARRCPACKQFEEITAFNLGEGAHYCELGGGWWHRVGLVWRFVGRIEPATA